MSAGWAGFRRVPLLLAPGTCRSSDLHSSDEPAAVLAMLAATGSLLATIWAALHPRTLLVAAVTFLLLADYFKNRRPKNYPPGPWGLPFVGNIFQLDFGQPHLSIQPLVKKYGNIFSLNLGDITSVVITGLPLIKEALTQMEQNIMNRPLSVMQERISNKNDTWTKLFKKETT